MSDTAFIFQAILLALLLVVIASWAGIKLAKWLGLIDYPASAPHKQHARPTPLAGGFVLFSVLLLSSWFFGALANREVAAIFKAATIVFLFGLLDDYLNVPPLVKLVGQLLAALLLIRLGVFIRFFESPEFFLQFGPRLSLYLDWLITFVWMVGITNAFNFIDSMDGLAVGMGGIAAAFFMLVTLDASQPALSFVSALVMGICIGLYYFNSPPAELFLGDSGAQTLGFILAALAIVYRPQGVNQSSSWLVPILLLGVPIFDTTLVIVSRLRRNRPVYAAARDHTYHRLLRFGIQPGRAVLTMQTASLALGCLAVVLLNQPPLVANLVFGMVLVGGFFLLLWLDTPNE